MSFSGKRYWLIGASEGLGAALAKALALSGAHVVVSARAENKLQALAAQLPNVNTAPLDVTDMAAVQHTAERLGPLDGIVYLAGYYDPMKAQNWESGAVAQMTAVNFTGALNVLGAIVPGFVARNAGHIVLIGSLAGYRGLPGSIGYGASKAALMHMGETLYADLHNTGVKVQNINPGFIKTRLTAKNTFQMPQLMQPEEAAQVMFEHMNTDRFKKSFPRVFSWVFRLSQFMPDWMYYRLFA